MTKPGRFRWLLVVALALLFNGFAGASPQTGSTPTEMLGQLEITVSKVELFTLIADRFVGGSGSFSQFGRVHLHFKDKGNSPVCVSLIASVEEYKGTELQYVQPLTRCTAAL
jgi:hypothetical protein